ncbi:tol-pal system protein YbgF [Franzmannia pantelleriensis]|uniref:Cell division coordinator CpoB n=1 Tax=Franzmannia pantelleriensis TaxID=48727 RepID=A0A1G9F4B3_9GAMM|nr:tol-pal system protein YbgF [Halomonas pantelleriensis]SDK83226.1 tol-pal system protein YbgF [Halomonas pantelleriensis]
MKHSLFRLCGAGALVLPLSVWAAPIVEDLSAQQQSRSFYEQTEVREPGGGSLMLLNQLEENQRQIQQLRGQLEELRHQLEQMRQLNQERYIDLEERLAAVGTVGGSPSVDPGAAQQVAAAGSGNGGAQAAYQEAFQQVQARDFPSAIVAFEGFVSDYPDHDLTANGYYWLGELHSAESDLDQAAAAFQTVIDDYAASNKVPDALYKLALLRARQGQPDASRELLDALMESYPDSNAATLASEFLNQSGL